MTEHSLCVEIEIHNKGLGVAFVPNGEYLVSGDGIGLRVWRAKDGAQTMRLTTENVLCLAVSKDGRWIAAGTGLGEVRVWNAKTNYEVVFWNRNDGAIIGVDFSPDSSRLVTASDNCTVWDIATHKQVLGPLKHNDWMRGVKYSPQGDRIATATGNCIRVYDSNDGHLLIEFPAGVKPHYNTGLHWSGANQLFILSDDKIKLVDASTGLAISEWPVPSTDSLSCIALPQHGQFVAYSTGRAVSFWDTSTHTQLGLIQHTHDISSIAFSQDDHFLAIGVDQKLAIHAAPSPIANSITFQQPDIQIDDVVFDSWKCDQLENAEALLTAAISTSPNPSHHPSASRALVRARLSQWDAALDDAEQSIRSQPSAIGYIAKSIALVGKGKKEKGYRTCDIALLHLKSAHTTFFLLIKAVITFIAGEHKDAILRVDDLIVAVPSNSAYMFLLQGNSQMEDGDYVGAMKSFERARAQMRQHDNRSLLLISLISGWKFDHLDITVRKHLCEALYSAGRTTEGHHYLREVLNILDKKIYKSGRFVEWVSDFKLRWCAELGHLGDTAMDAQCHDEAISLYSAALSLNPGLSQGLFIKRSKAQMAKKLWDGALNDANEAIERNPSSPWGYKAKHAALHGAKRYVDAVEAFNVMLLKMAQSPDPDIRECRTQYISPSNTRSMIRKIIQRNTRHSPRVLINTSTGRLQSRAEQTSAFESSPAFHELVSSMTTHIDRSRIKEEVKHFFRYVMLSHRWEENEPLFQQAVHVAVYDLDSSPTHDKLQTFCKIVRDAGFNWAWSDTCCIDKQDHFVLQEALVAMFKWYRNSALVIVYLLGVRSPAQLGDLVRSTWNTRVWTFQEYVAGKVVHFYTEDWNLYLDLKVPNHKESPKIISEMEQATGVSAERLLALRPGLNNIREKLSLAANRKTTLIEDAAYSLLGIFSVTGIPAIYGEGESALGRLLAHILTGSGDVSILAWTGQSSNVNSCLPARINVYMRPATLYLPLRIEDAEMDNTLAALRDSPLDLDLAMRLYDRLNELPTPLFAANRLKLPCIAFKFPSFSPHQTRLGRVYRAEVPSVGVVEIKTRRDLSRLNSFYVVHPWLDALLGRGDTHVNAFVEDDIVEPFSPGADGEDTDEEGVDEDEEEDEEDEEEDEEDVEEGEKDDDDDEIEDSSPLSEPQSRLSPLPVAAVPLDRETRALQLIARLKQSFGALLFMLASTNGREEYRRVVADSLITVQIQEGVSLEELVENVRILDVL